MIRQNLTATFSLLFVAVVAPTLKGVQTLVNSIPSIYYNNPNDSISGSMVEVFRNQSPNPAIASMTVELWEADACGSVDEDIHNKLAGDTLSYFMSPGEVEFGVLVQECFPSAPTLNGGTILAKFRAHHADEPSTGEDRILVQCSL